MASLLLDTHVFAWTLAASPLPERISEAIGRAEAVYVSPISFYEIGQKVRLGKWPQMAPYVAALPDILRQQNGLVATLTPEIALLAATAPWPLTATPFDRMLAATSLISAIPLASVDSVFDSFEHRGRRIDRIG